MSYSLLLPCSTCAKSKPCTDRHFLIGAVSGIHNMNLSPDFGHMGYGSIRLECSAYVQEPQPVAENK